MKHPLLVACCLCFLGGLVACQPLPPGAYYAPNRYGMNQPSMPSGSEYWITEKIDSGRFYKLNDGSVWQISAYDRPNAILWMVVDNITIIERDGGYVLFNSTRNESASARRVR